MSYRIKKVLAALLLTLPLTTYAQISIGGNIYGGGNAGNTNGGTKVTMYAGDIHGSVFGGARQANVGGSAFVHIDGEHASNYMVINRVYGGNDIAGTIGTSASVPSGLTRTGVNGIDNTWNAFVRLSSKTGAGTTTTYYTPEEAKAYNAALDGAITTSTSLTAAQATAINELNLTGEDEYTAGNTPSQAAADAYNATLPGAKSTSDIKTASSNHKIYIGQLFGGSNGDYLQHEAGGKYYIYPSDGADLNADIHDGVFNDYITSSTTEFSKPDISKAYMEVMGGSIVYAYGGGNNATITESNVICVDNPTEVVNHIYVDGEGTEVPTATETNAASLGVTDLLTEARFEEMGINTVFSHPSSGEYQIGCFFGGNNVADMDIRPRWDLMAGKIRSLYSGGNRGRMLSASGLLIEIPSASTLEVGDLYGGCRMADVRPMRKISEGVYEDVTHVYNIDGYYFPAELAARTLIRGGRITNVYGGNDVRGKVYFGNAVGIYTTVYGNVYGGGNGAYPYTDNPDLANNTYYSDFYYNPTQVLEDAGYSISDISAMNDQMKSVTALNLIRPNAEQVSVRVMGASEDHQTLIEGQLFCGGNCATLRTDTRHASLPNYPLVELKMGSHAIINEAFLGNNGAYMVQNEKNDEVKQEYDVLQLYTKTSGEYKHSAASRYTRLDLTDADIFAEYMEGCAMNIMPRLSFDNTENGDPDDYEEYKSQIGSLYCGGNVGSMTKPGLTTINFNSKLIIFDKIVGGCNKAYVAALSGVNAEYNGGVIGEKGNDRDNYLEDGNIKNRLVLNFNTLKIQPKRWKKNGAGEYVLDAYGNRTLEFNTVDSRLYDPVTKTYQPMAPVTSGGESTATEDDVARRLNGGHIYGGCYENGSINGNVVINLNNSVIDRDLLFDVVETDDASGEAQLYGHEHDYRITTRHTGVILDEQGMDVLGVALNVFGGGKGAGTEIWGSTVINLNGGYTFQIFGGSEEGVIGKGETYTGPAKADYTWEDGYYYFNGKRYQKDSRYSCYVNLCGTKAGVSKKADQSEEMAECEFMYGGSFFGPVCGNTVINLGNGRIFNSFAGSCNGDILGTAETFIGRQVKEAYRIERPSGVVDHDVFEPAFPWIRDIVYGANDLGGRILGENNYKTHVRGQRAWDTDYTTDFNPMSMVHAHDGDDADTDPDVLQASAYVEYLQGRADAIFAGCYGTYDYKNRKFSRYTDANGEPLTFDGSSAPKFYKPRLNNGVVNFRPTYHSINNVVKKVYGAGQGQAGETDRDKLQNRSYVLIDIPDGLGNYNELEVFGAGAWGGVGFNVSKETFNADKDKGAAIVDLLRGTIDAAYGGSYEEGVTRRTQVNVPNGSTITVNNIFGGAYGTLILPPCDVYESYVKYDSEDARVTGAIFGGNNNERRTVFTKVDINKPVITGASYPVYATVYGAGKGQDTWAEYTEVNLNNGAKVHEVYGGGQMGHVLNAESVQKYMNIYSASGLNRPSADIAKKNPYWSNTERWNGLEDGKIVDSSTLKSSETAQWAADWAEAWKLGDYFTPTNYTSDYVNNTETNLNSSLVRTASELDTRTAEQLGNRGKKYNTNVIINQGATVANYAYGGGLGDTDVALSGDVYGTTYIALLGGEVTKDIYAAGTAGSVDDLFGAGFTASANVYIKGGTVRNVYGGGWRGSVGYHPSSTGAAKGDISDVAANAYDVFGESNVVIGDIDGASYASGVPSVTRNVYGGGEGGAIFGTANVYMNNGYIGYRFKGSDPATANAADYSQELHDVADGDSLLYKSGNIFGGGYVANSYVDNSNIKMYGGVVRGSLYGGGEVGPIGRGTMLADAPTPTGTVFNGPDNAAKIYKPGKALVELFEGHVLRNVFGGGRGHDNWGGEGYMTKEEEQTMDRSSKGYVFGQTRVNIRGGEIGTDEGMAENFGNVFGGSDVGYVYSAYVVDKAKNGVGHKSGNRYDGGDEGYYYRYEYDEVAGKFDYVKDGGSKIFTEGCKVVVGPYCKVTDEGGITLTGIFYPKGAVIADVDLKYLKANDLNTGDYDASGKVTNPSGITIASRTYNKGEYVPTYALHTLKDKNSDEGKPEEPGPKQWKKLDDHGVIIHNAVFAGGNVSSGTTEVFANATTVYGNATATIHDVYHRDLITVGTGHTGGLYGDGNLTFVDGFRDLNITNYGTDYYNISMEITYETYKTLPKREQAYYEIKYTCLKDCTDNNGKTYHPASGSIQASTITGDELLLRFEGVHIPKDENTPMLDATGKPHSDYWVENGVCSRYAGRIMNTIQRADFCGVFGSRMVMQGAKDRVPEVVDNANYTINRVREVSLNKKTSIIPSDLTTKTEGGKTVYVNPKAAEHGNYFGIYSNVNFLGALTSDVFFTKSTTAELASDATHLETSGNVRTTNMTDDLKADGKTFYEWKHNHMLDHKGNRGTCHNELALASGVYLEITSETSTGTTVNDKVWGEITGVIMLDLINVQKGVGGGFVYAKNVHGVPTFEDKPLTSLTALNEHALSRKDFTYTTDDASQQEWETSGNFIHDTQTIIDDCYPESNRYKGSDKVPAHYWYIKGTVYIYDQYISAYTGAPNAYSKVVNIPLTITAASHGTMKLMDIQPNHYAFYSSNKFGSTPVKLKDDDVLEINGKEYRLNTPITYWDYNILSAAEQRLFKPMTYVTIAECQTGGKTYPAGYVMLPEEYETLRSAAVTKTIEGKSVKAVTSHGADVPFDFVFRKSNNMSHDRGYILTYEVNNPKQWNKWYTPKTGDATGKINTTAYGALSSAQQDNYYYSPTYKPTVNGLYGQQSYSVGAIIPQKVYDDYEGYDSDDDGTPDKGLKIEHPTAIPASGQAEFAPAYLVTKTIEIPATSTTPVTHLYPGATVVESDFAAAKWTEMKTNGIVKEAYVCTSTVELEDKSLLTVNTVMTAADKAQYKTDNTSLATTIEDIVKPAYYCTTAGDYGGDYYETTKNYRGLAAWSSLSEKDRKKFTFNYDALDVFIDSTYSRPEGYKYQYDGFGYTSESDAKHNAAEYSLLQPVDYTATYRGTTESPGDMTYKDKDNVSQTVTVGTELSREAYEALPNEKHHFAPIEVPTGSPYKVHIVRKAFIHGNSPYAAGQTVSGDDYASLTSTDLANVITLEFTSADAGKTYYFCRENYTIGEKGEGESVKNIKAGTGYDDNGAEVTLTADQTFGAAASVPIGVIITEDNYKELTNRQKGFTIHGVAPVETSTLYVSRESDIYDLSTEKIITVIYEYDYEESDEEGMHITPVSERHVVNIHITFESGVPSVEDISAPKIVLPGTLVNLRTPNVTPGAYEVTGGGWMLFEKEDDTDSHNNGIEFTPTTNPLYWYQNGYYVAYYAQTYLGKTFSNAVKVSVANYHDIADVMADRNKTHHMYIDDPNVERDSKIYITTQDGIDRFKELFDLSLIDLSAVAHTDSIITTTDHAFEGHHLLNPQVKEGQNLEFYMRTDIDHSATPWTSIAAGVADGDPCFSGNLHGDGHTISGLSSSLFGKLCGNVYNLGVRGTFAGAGIAETGKGYIENCWVSSTAATKTTQPVFGNPSRTGDKLIQVVNSYYQEEDATVGTAGSYSKQITDNNVSSHGTPIRKPLQAFYNGEVAYDLNGFYLYKRYANSKLTSGTSHSYYTVNPADNKLSTPQSGFYGTADGTYSSSGVSGSYAAGGYVEERFRDGDFIYSGGSIPDDNDERMHVDGNGDSHYYPIWPDDYLFFGQALNYGHMDGNNGRDLREPQDWPSAVNKNTNRILATLQGNRVYRAPAYYRSGNMGVAHFNRYAVFAQSKNEDPATLAYKNMTAIDFTGGNGDVATSHQLGKYSTAPYNNVTALPDGAFYPPLLDDDGLKGFYNVNLTNNLLAYTSSGEPGTPEAMTSTAVSAHLPDEAYVETDDTYRTVGVWDRFSGYIRGHWVQLQDGDYVAPNDHMLVDRQDFNAPIAYDMGSGKRMWYQREPERFVDRTKGWETVSLPFTAEIVTTQKKGEITHFYSRSNKSDNSDAKIGHEYWLREFTAITNANNPTPALASFTYPTSAPTDKDKTVTNTFLWDYYYEATTGHNQNDQNLDKYQEYYSEPRTYEKYAHLKAAKPYIIGFPGKTYFEFDLSGQFGAATTAQPNPEELRPQVITFASDPATHINVSDSEMDGTTMEQVDGGNKYRFTFKPSYLNMSFDAGTDTYVMDATGESFDKVPAASVPPAAPVAATPLDAFRPYFISDVVSSVKGETRSIIFSNIDDTLAPEEFPDEPQPTATGYLDIRAEGRRIIVSSYLEAETTVHIFAASGALLDTYKIAPNQTVETRVHNTGIYLVNRKKLSIK